MADLSKLRFNGTDYNVKDASAPLRKFTNYSKTGNLPITSDDTTQTAIGKLENALDSKINTSAKGTANGVAELDANGKVPSSQLPSYVDDVLEYSAKSSFPSTGETGKIYVDTSTNKTYRWSGSAYVEISESLALGETSSTAYRGDRGKAAYDHSQTSGNPHGTTGANTNLTGYSKGSSTSAVTATDTVNAAIAKHENRIDTNQSNILYNLNMGVKNILPNLSGTYTAATTTYTWNYNGEIHFKSTDSSTHAIDIGTFTLKAGTYVLDDRLVYSSGGEIQGDLRFSVNGENVTNDVTSIFTLSQDSIVTVKAYTYGIVDTTITPLLCTKAAWDQSHDYQPPALPNYDLTRLEAEDRAALAEEIDAGAKNKWDFANATFVQYNNSTYTKTSDDITVTSTGTWAFASYALPIVPAGKYVISFTVSNLSGNTARLLISSSSQASTGSYYEPVLAPSNGNYNLEFTSTGSQLYVLFYPNYSGTSSTTAKYTASNIMLCTKAAFGVSQKFVPYKTDFITWSLKPWANLKSGDNLDNVTSMMVTKGVWSMFAAGTNDVLNKPTAGIFFVRTLITDQNTGIQIVTMLTGNDRGKSYIRNCAGGNWDTWKETTNT